MRITGGIYRGRKLSSPKGLVLRPTLDRVREALFNILASRVHGANFLDCFGGTGAVGLEAISRGAARVVIIEENRKFAAMIQRNATALEAEPTLICADFFKSTAKLHADYLPFEIAFVDPPYLSGVQEQVLESLSERNLISEDGVVIVEHDKRKPIADHVADLVRVDERAYGETVLSFYEPGKSI